MRSSRLLSVLLLSSMCAMASDNAPRTISDLPPAAQARIRQSLPHRVHGSTEAQQSFESGEIPADGPWAQLAELTPSTDQVGIFFATSMAISGDTVVIGQPYGYQGPYYSEVFVFTRPLNGDWNDLTQSAILVGTDVPESDLFGSAVAISGDTIVVGAPAGECHCGPGNAYVYVKPQGGWSGQLTQTATLVGSDSLTDDSFGSSVAISGNTVIVGAPSEGSGSAYVFVEPPGGWSSTGPTAKLTSSHGGPGDQLGASVSISDNTVVAGAPRAIGSSATRPGAVFVFTESSSGWSDMTQTARLLASDEVPSAALGQSVAINGTAIVAGAPYATGNATRTGASYIFVEPPSGWQNATQSAKLKAPDGQGGDAFGSAVALTNDTIVVGAPERSRGSNNRYGIPFFGAEGGAYVFSNSTNDWTKTEVQVLTGSDARNDSRLGSTVGVEADLVVAGAPNWEKYTGAAFMFVNSKNLPLLWTPGGQREKH